MSIDNRPLPLRALEDLLNRALAGDPVSEKRLTGLVGKQVQVWLQPPGLGLAIEVDGSRLKLSVPTAAGEGQPKPHLDMRASPGAMLAQLVRALGGAPPQATGMTISGDAELARQLAELAQNYRPEPAALLSPLVGDVMAQTIAEGLAGAGRFARRAAERLASSGSEYLREESRVLIAPAEQELFIDAVETLRDDVERAEARLNRLLSRRGAAR